MGLEQDIASVDTLRRGLRDALAHLYDPSFEPDEGLREALGCEPEEGVEAVQENLIGIIRKLEPGPDVPTGARVRRLYEILQYRYVECLTQEETAERFGITSRHLRREQQEAIDMLSRRLWRQRAQPDAPATVVRDDAAERTGGVSPHEWQSQVQQELASLQESAPGVVADVEEAVRGATELGRALALRHGVNLDARTVPAGLTAAIHPSALRQVIIVLVGQLLEHLPEDGKIALRVEQEDGELEIAITGCPATGAPGDNALVREIVQRSNGSVETCVDGDKVTCLVRLRAIDEITVLVVDDNLDLVHFYRRYTAGTRYQIVHTSQAQQVLETAEACAPSIIVLDVMLPDMDGWELLALLHEHPATRSTPVVVCSVVREEELALALGARSYLSKPVRRQQFIQALDHALRED